MENARKRAVSVKRFLTNWVDLANAALNGIVGDYMIREKNPLAIPMHFRHRDAVLDITAESIAAAHPDTSGKLCILVHGLCCTEMFWKFSGRPNVTYGELLKRDLGYTPHYLRYNSGAHVSENGQALSRLLEELCRAYPRPVTEIILMGHSMGGLVCQSACHYGKKEKRAWAEKVSRVFLLGAPQLGAPLEKGAHAFTHALKAVPNPWTHFTAEFINLRSSGIKDLRFGYTRQIEWQGHDPDALWKDRKLPPARHRGIKHYAVAGSITRNPSHPVSFALGDYLVRLPSAHGAPRKEHGDLHLDGFRLLAGVNHFYLCRSPKVYRHIKKWCMLDKVENIRALPGPRKGEEYEQASADQGPGSGPGQPGGEQRGGNPQGHCQTAL